LKGNLTRAIQEVLQNPTSAIPATFKISVRRDTPEEAETLMRLEALESVVRRLSDDVPFGEPPATLERTRAFIVPTVGRKVRHWKFGAGEVIQLMIVEGEEPRAQVNFEDVGVKWLSLPVANLEYVSPC